jgi:hypothetical protein
MDLEAGDRFLELLSVFPLVLLMFGLSTKVVTFTDAKGLALVPGAKLMERPNKLMLLGSP